MVYGICLATCHRLHMTSYTVGDLDLIEYTAVKGHMRGYPDPCLTDIHNGRISGMTPYACLISGIFCDTVHRVADNASRAAYRSVSDP